MLNKNTSSRVYPFLQDLNTLQILFFKMLQDADYPHRHEIYAQELHFVQARIWKKLLSFRAKLPVPVMQHLETLYENILTIGQLRERVEDFTELTLLKNEFVSLQQVLSEQLLKKSITLSHQDVLDRIITLYTQALTVMAKNPVIYLLWIEEIANCFDHLQNLQESVL